MKIRNQTGMTMVRMVIFIGLSVADVSWSADQYREFHDTQGRSFKGHIITFDDASQMVTMRREDGKTGQIPLSTLSEPDRLFILDGCVSAAFQQGLDIYAQIQSKKVSSKDTGVMDVANTVFDSWYDIRLDNDTKTTLGKMEFEYCIFYKQGVRDGMTVHYGEGIVYGKGVVDGLKPDSTHVVKTKPVRLYTENGNITVFGEISVSDALVRGIWVRLKTTLPSGGQLVRDYRTSDDPIWKWTPQTIAVGLNDGPKADDFVLKLP